MEFLLTRELNLKLRMKLPLAHYDVRRQCIYTAYKLFVSDFGTMLIRLIMYML